MKKWLFLAIVAFAAGLLTLSGCKKAVEDLTQQQQEDLVVRAMTDGKWKMTWFKENGTGISDFNGYEFKYYSNYTVDAFGGGTTIRGTWGGNASNMTTNAEFPNSAGNPLLKINGTWNIIRNGWTYVEARQVSGGVTKEMRLDKL
jgi:hypothetical protein